jgi:hypothetical protein
MFLYINLLVAFQFFQGFRHSDCQNPRWKIAAVVIKLFWKLTVYFYITEGFGKLQINKKLLKININPPI